MEREVVLSAETADLLGLVTTGSVVLLVLKFFFY